MPIYKFKCATCSEEAERIESVGTEIVYCDICGQIAQRMHGSELPAPAQIEAGVGGVYKPRYGERKYS
ncbi:MAG: hypothetical protein GY799_21235 [Desulfobulbaceae bacterium]|nr:hypothetical protein [Desulfobulbaceae bacterium]